MHGPHPGVERGRRREDELLDLGSGGDLDLDPLSVRSQQPGVADVEVADVQPYIGSRVGDLDLDVLDADERRRFEVGLDAEVVPAGQHGAGETFVHAPTLGRTTRVRRPWTRPST